MRVGITSDTHYGYNHKTHSIHIEFLSMLAKEELDVLVHCGDWASSDQIDLFKSLKMFRAALGQKVKIITVMGNHDLWDSSHYITDGRKRYRNRRPISYAKMLLNHDEWLQTYNIELLSATKSVQIGESIIFYGFNGWCDHLISDMNDSQWMPKTIQDCPAFTYLRHKAQVDLESIVQAKEAKKKDNPHLTYVCVTHHHPFAAHLPHHGADLGNMDIITNNFDVLMCGHSHEYADFIVNRCRVLNAGSTYNIPKYKIVEMQ